MTVPISDVVLGVTHLLVGGELLPLFKCPYCGFKNIHESEIIHHIRYKEDSKHNVDVDSLDKSQFVAVVTKKESRYIYTKKEDLPLPWIRCLWCNYKDKIARDLEWHFIEKHRPRLNSIKVSPEQRRNDSEWRRDRFSWMYSDLEYRVYKALKLAKKRSGIAATK